MSTIKIQREDNTEGSIEIAEERIIIRNKINNFSDEEMRLAIFVCEEMKRGHEDGIYVREHMENWIYKTGYDLRIVTK